jgi:hypothetical protein
VKPNTVRIHTTLWHFAYRIIPFEGIICEKDSPQVSVLLVLNAVQLKQPERIRNTTSVCLKSKAEKSLPSYTSTRAFQFKRTKITFARVFVLAISLYTLLRYFLFLIYHKTHLIYLNIYYDQTVSRNSLASSGYVDFICRPVRGLHNKINIIRM